MKNYSARLLAVLALALSVNNTYALDQSAAKQVAKPIEVNISGTRILIPEPKNYSDPSSMMPAIRQFGENMTASTNRLLNFFMSDDDVKALLAQSAPQLHRYFMVQTLRAAEGVNMSEREYGMVRDQLKSQYKKLFDENAARMQSEIDMAVDRLKKDSKSPQAQELSLKLGEMKVLEVIGDDSYVSLIAKTLVQANVNGELKQIPMVMGLTNTMVKGKILYFFAYARLNSDEDIAWIKSQTATWIPSLFAANKVQ